MEEKYLPIGTVCMLKGGKKRVMIVGFTIIPKENQTMVYDYMGALYPEGILSNDQSLVFNHDQIETIVAKGYSDEEQISFNTKLKSYIATSGLTQAPTEIPEVQNQQPVQQSTEPQDVLTQLQPPIIPTIQPAASTQPVGITNLEFEDV